MVGCIVKENLSYNPETGEFKWVRPVGNCAKASAGFIADNGYQLIGWCGRLYRAHTLAWYFVHGVWSPLLDHINQIKTDNRINNLREVNRSENAYNSKLFSTNRSGLRGVSYDKARNKWRATLTRNYKQVHTSRHDTAEQAYVAYRAAVVAQGVAQFMALQQ